ncbi:MAG: hypothetical protein H6755_07585 [Candidatus Omnitrophica bacterium]|nr:hypothetical protein [Candidatus Omnitrophota bacterium]MCB9748254.1 hypothetical protein [Candidatus Omnitrophota bacterium]
MFKELKNSDKGIVFITVLIIIIVVMILTISIISLNVNQVLVSEHEVKRIQAETLALGALALTVSNQMSDSPNSIITLTTTLDGVNFDVVSNLQATNSLDIDVSY